MVGLTTTVSAANAYFQVLAAQDRLQVARNNLQSATRVLNLIQQRLNAGTASALDIAQQESLVNSQRAAIPPLQQIVTQNRNVLAVLMARSPESVRIRGGSLRSIALPRVTPGLPSELLTQRPDIREAEAVSGIETFGMHRNQARFLNLPFYQTGKTRKDPIGPEDVRITLELLEERKPDLVFVAGDLTDPHGTHRMCMESVLLALGQYSGSQPEIWYYRGAWQEWGVGEADVLVPLSEDELRVKKLAIFKHQSQKDRAPFPGQDDREFWQRVEDRNMTTAKLVDRLGLPEYFAMEAYVVRKGGAPLERENVPTASLGAR